MTNDEKNPAMRDFFIADWGWCDNLGAMTDVDKYQKLKNYADKISKIVYDEAQYEIEALFYLTRHCNLTCPGCYMRGSPYQSRDVLPGKDVKFYLDEFTKVPNFTESVVFSGGEIFTAPINYVEYNAHQVLDRGWALQLKTNGSWVQNTQTRDSVLAMLRRLQPHRGLRATDADVKRFLGRVPRGVWRILGRDLTRVLMYQALPTAPMLDMAVSVDDKLHPAQSADWFNEIAQIITTDRRLRDKVNLKTFTLTDSVPFFEKNVLNSGKLKIENFCKRDNKALSTYTVNGRRVESYVGNFVDTAHIQAGEKLSNIVVPAIGDGAGRLVYCFYPDRTVGFDCNYLESVGRVPYIDEKGEYKSINRIRRDIYTQLVQEYGRAISK